MSTPNSRGTGVVDEVKAHRQTADGASEYLVGWAKCDDYWFPDSWESASSLDGCRSLVDAYHSGGARTTAAPRGRKRRWQETEAEDEVLRGDQKSDGSEAAEAMDARMDSDAETEAADESEPETDDAASEAASGDVEAVEVVEESPASEVVAIGGERLVLLKSSPNETGYVGVILRYNKRGGIRSYRPRSRSFSVSGSFPTARAAAIAYARADPRQHELLGLSASEVELKKLSMTVTS